MPLQKPLLLPHIINEVCFSCDHPMEEDSVYDGALRRRLRRKEKKCTKKCAARAKLLLGSVVKLDRASVHIQR